MKTYKAVSTVIATLLMLIITIALAGTAYFYITSITTSATSIVIGFDTTRTFCDGTNIHISVKNDGTGPVDKFAVFIAGRNSAGDPFTDTECESAAGDDLNAGTADVCGGGVSATVFFDGAMVPNPVTVGTNIITARAGGSTSQISVSCSG